MKNQFTCLCFAAILFSGCASRVYSLPGRGFVSGSVVLEKSGTFRTVLRSDTSESCRTVGTYQWVNRDEIKVVHTIEEGSSSTCDRPERDELWRVSPRWIVSPRGTRYRRVFWWHP